MTQSNLGFPLKDMQEAERLALQRDVAMSRHGRIQDPEKVQRAHVLGSLPLVVPKYTPQNMPDFTGQVMALTPIGGATAYHGGGKLFKKFEDKYMLSGEGNWTYGAGHYSGEAKGTGEAYRRAASRKGGHFPTKTSGYTLAQHRFSPAGIMGISQGVDDAIRHSERASKQLRDSIESSKNILNIPKGSASMKATTRERMGADKKNLKESDKATKTLKKWKKNPHKMPAHLYEKEVPDEEIAKLLDWDKPFANQTEHVKKITDRIRAKKGHKSLMNSSMTGGEFYNTLVEDTMDSATRFQKPYRYGRQGRNEAKRKVSQMLLKAGIPGNKFLDQGSRPSVVNWAPEKQTYNYVEFTAKGKEGAIRKIDEQPVEEVFANTTALGKLSSMFGK